MNNKRINQKFRWSFEFCLSFTAAFGLILKICMIVLKLSLIINFRNASWSINLIVRGQNKVNDAMLHIFARILDKSLDFCMKI